MLLMCSLRMSCTYIIAVPLTPPLEACITRVTSACFKSSESTPNSVEAFLNASSDSAVTLQPPDDKSGSDKYIK